MIGEYFYNKCKTTKVELEPWPHQIIQDSLPSNIFESLRKECEKLNISHHETVHIYPKDYKKYNINFYNETVDICKNILENATILCEQYPKYRWFKNLAVNAHISITPPLPFKFYIHQEGLEKIWSSVTYITPEKNVGTKMYKEQRDDAFVKEAKWIPNTTFIFCGHRGKTWHSYESNQTTNRITFNLFLMKDNDLCFYRL
ncbi:MAG: hypothetical protein KYX68_11680 [Flavobacterium sp.]|nr:hypothetical protein [Flavobacterium sp.]